MIRLPAEETKEQTRLHVGKVWFFNLFCKLVRDIKPENGRIWINTDVREVYLTYFMILFMR